MASLINCCALRKSPNLPNPMSNKHNNSMPVVADWTAILLTPSVFLR